MNKLTNLITFDFGGVKVRTAKDDKGLALFVCKDVAIALEYNNNNMSDLFGHVPDEWKGRERIPTLGGEQEMLCVSEQGLYFFVCRSDKPKALPFQKWVAGEVLPSIFNTGSYNLPKKELELPKPSEFLTSLELKLNPYQNEKLIEFLDSDILVPERLPSEIGVRTEQFTDVFERNGKAVTSSLVVADAFNKKHSSVMRSIDSLITKIRDTYPNEDCESLFYGTTYISSNNRVCKCYCITRQGFVFLVFSFTGTRAMQYKYPLYRRLEEYDTLLLVRRITEDHQSYKTDRMLCMHDLSKQES